MEEETVRDISIYAASVAVTDYYTLDGMFDK